MAAKKDQKGNKSPLRKASIASALLVVCLAAAAGGMALSMGPAAFLSVFGVADEGTDAPGEAEPTNGPVNPEKAAALGATAPELEILPFDEMIVNITALTLSGRRTSRFLKVNMVVLYDPLAEGAAQISARHLYLRDSFQDYLRQLHVSDLEGSAGLARLKSELLRRARAVSDSDAPRDVLIADLVIQ